MSRESRGSPIPIKRRWSVGLGKASMSLQSVASRFTFHETRLLWRRFLEMENRLKSKEDQYEPGFQTGPTKYYFYDMPSNYEVEDFVASWM